MELIATLVSLFTLTLMGLVILQLRQQKRLTEELIADQHIRTQLFQDADESTTFILGRTIQNISSGTHDPNLESDSFTLRVVRELVKRRVPKDRWLEIQSNERLVHELYLLLREAQTKKSPREVARAKS